MQFAPALLQPLCEIHFFATIVGYLVMGDLQ